MLVQGVLGFRILVEASGGAKANYIRHIAGQVHDILAVDT